MTEDSIFDEHGRLKTRTVSDETGSITFHHDHDETPISLDPWEPIETVPRDGSPVLLYWPEVEQPYQIAWWGKGGWELEDESIDHVGQPTHWKPLRPPE